MDNDRLKRIVNIEIGRKYANSSGLIIGITPAQLDVIRMGISLRLSYQMKREARKVLRHRKKGEKGYIR